MTPDEPLEAWKKAQIEILSASFEHASRYSNIFILAGYGAFFGLWNVTHDRLNGHRAPILAALFMLVSVTIFVSYQIYNVYLHSSAMIQMVETFIDKPPAAIDDLLQRIDEQGYLAKARTPGILRIWRPTFFFTIGTGLLAFVTLGWAFVRTLLW